MTSLTDNLFARLLTRLTDAVLRYPKWFFYPQVALFGLSVFYTIHSLQFASSRRDLVGANKRYHQNFLQFRDEFPSQLDNVVVVESEDAEKNRQFVERLGAKLEAETNLFRNVFYKGDLRMLGRKALLFVPEDKLGELKEALRDYKPFIRQFTHATNLVSLFNLVNRQFSSAKREDNAENQSLVKALPVLERIVTQGMAALQRPGMPPSPGINALFGAGQEAEQQQYLTFTNKSGAGRIYLVTAQTPDETLSADTVERLAALVEETKGEVQGLNVGITGEPVLEHDEMVQSQKDSTLATIVSLLLSAVIFIYGYQETGRPVKATLCLIVGLGYTMGFTTLVVGHLNILTIMFLPILIGLAIDFGVHLISRYEEELRQGRSEAEALKKAMVFTGQGILSGALTTAGAFLAMSLTDFKGIQEMGLISGGGLLICLVPMMTMLPVMLLRGRQNVIDHEIGNTLDRRARIEQIWLRRPVLVTGIALGLCGLSLTQFHKVHFDYNLLHMQSEGLPAVEYGNKLLNSGSKSLLFAAVVADSLPEALELEKKIRLLSTVAEVQSMAPRLSGDQAGKLAAIGEIKQEIAGMRFAEMDARTVRVEELSATLWSLQGYLGAAADEVSTNDAALFRQLTSLRSLLVLFRKEMLEDDHGANGRKLAVFQQALFHDIHETFAAMQQQDNSGPLRTDDLPPSLRERFIGLHGKFLLQVFPKNDVWQRENQEAFIGELRRALDPQDTNRPVITGTPVQLYEYTSLLRSSYETAAWYALAAISLLVFVQFRSVASVVLALLPVLVGSIWLGGFMGFFGITFNPANIMILPLMIGIGVTSGIQILNRFAEEHSPVIFAKSTGKAVLVSGLTTIAGFGSLILGKHRGIESLGYVMAVGVAACMIAGLTFLPALLNLLNRRNLLK